MTEERKDTPEPEVQSAEQVQDLEIRTEEADKVKGGRARYGDPCDGGE